MKKEDLYKEIGLLDEEIIEEADCIEHKNHFVTVFVKFAAVAVCLVIVVAVLLPLIRRSPVKQEPYRSVTRSEKPVNSIDAKMSIAKEPNLAALTGGVTGKFVNEVPREKVLYDLAELSYEEIFNKWGKVIVQGTVIKIQNIELDFKELKEYRAIATIYVEKVYQGKVSEGDEVNILLPCGISNDWWTEDCGVISCLKVGMKGIFMSYIYDDNAYMEMNGVTLYLKELADYGLGDGERFAFLSNDGGLVYDQYTYKELKGAKSLKEVGVFIEHMLKKYKTK